MLRVLRRRSTSPLRSPALLSQPTRYPSPTSSRARDRTRLPRSSRTRSPSPPPRQASDASYRGHSARSNTLLEGAGGSVSLAHPRHLQVQPTAPRLAVRRALPLLSPSLELRAVAIVRLAEAAVDARRENELSSWVRRRRYGRYGYGRAASTRS